MDTVYQAISALYDNPNANEKEKASIWLGDIQKSVSTPLLSPDSCISVTLYRCDESTKPKSNMSTFIPDSFVENCRRAVATKKGCALMLFCRSDHEI